MSMAHTIETRLHVLAPQVLLLENESKNHSGYFEGKESHFKLIIVSEVFSGLRPVARHQKVYAALGDVLGVGGVHALAIHAYTPEEYHGQNVASPVCHSKAGTPAR